MFLRSGLNRGGSGVSDRLSELKDKVLGITVVFITHQPRQSLLGTLEIKDKAIEHRILSALQFIFRNRSLPDFGNFPFDRLDKGHGSLRSRLAPTDKDTVIVILCCPEGINHVGQTLA